MKMEILLLGTLHYSMWNDFFYPSGIVEFCAHQTFSVKGQIIYSTGQ